MANLKTFLPADVELYAHWMGWFGKKSHKDVGYLSADIKTVQRQVSEMKALGIDGVIPDWYGPESQPENISSLHMLGEVERNGMKYAQCVDQGAIKNFTANPTQRVIDLVNYTINTFAQSGSYWTIGGRPLILFFGDSGLPIDWNAARAGMKGNPLLIFQNKAGFTHAQSDGAFSWLKTQQNSYDPSLDYLFDFYNNRDATKIGIGSLYPGFFDPNPTDPTKSVWDITKPVRTIGRRGGVTFLDTCMAVPADCKFLQIVTWNDHDEGSNIEFGIGPIVDRLLSL